MHTPIAFITDTTDDNARGRVTTRVHALFGTTPTFVGVTYPSQLEAAGNLIDQIDALDGRPGIIFVNVAPRSVTGTHSGNKGINTNGSPFCTFWYKKILVLATLDGLTLSLVKKLKLIDKVGVLHLSEADTTQFRSYHILPTLGAALFRGDSVSHSFVDIEEVADCPRAVWLVDAHGNCKTTLFASEVSGTERVLTRWGTLPRFRRLKDVPDGVTAIVEGSSGIGNRRFLEIVTQGGSATELLSIRAGDEIH